jgi:hypothetical protein
MNVQTYTDPALDVRPASAFVGFWAALANLTSPGEASLAEAETALAEGEANIDRGIEAIARLVANSRLAAERGERIEWDYLIERLGFYETDAARDLWRIERLVARLLMLVPAQARRARTLARRQQDAVARFVEALRDARWQAMASRAHFDSASRGGRVFSDTAELHRYLAKA